MTDGLKQRLRNRYMDTKKMIPVEICHEAAARIEQLEKERDELKQTCVDHAEIQQTLLAERDELLADAMRYRAIKQWHKAYVLGGIAGGINIHLLTSTRWPEQLDAAIDEASAKVGGYTDD